MRTPPAWTVTLPATREPVSLWKGCQAPCGALLAVRVASVEGGAARIGTRVAGNSPPRDGGWELLPGQILAPLPLLAHCDGLELWQGWQVERGDPSGTPYTGRAVLVADAPEPRPTGADGVDVSGLDEVSVFASVPPSIIGAASVTAEVWVRTGGVWALRQYLPAALSVSVRLELAPADERVQLVVSAMSGAATVAYVGVAGLYQPADAPPVTVRLIGVEQ